jgi:GDP-L-fucose synthase
MKILLTGSSGMVARNFLDHKFISNYTLLTPSSSELDLRNFELVKKYLEKQKPELIIHTAGIVGGIEANLRDPVKFFLENLDIGRNIVWAARNFGVKKLINLGTSCMYPINLQTPLKEEFILKGELEPTNEAYALAKIMTARLCQYIKNEDSNFQYKTIIPCNLYGRHDNFNPGYSHLIPAAIYKIHEAKKKRKKTVEIWGNGLARREFLYAGDFADALMNAIIKFNSLPDVINIGLGYDFTVQEYYEKVAEVVGYNGSFVYNLHKPVGTMQKLVSIERQKKWGWCANSNLKFGIENTYEYYLKAIN